MPSLFIFGLGYTALRVGGAAREQGWQVAGTGRAGITFDDDARVRPLLAAATHVLSSVPPGDLCDPVLAHYGDGLQGRALGYLSSTGVYGDTGGAWVDEGASMLGRRAGRNRADADWLARGARVYRLPGIYGPGRSPLDRLRDGSAHRVDLPGQVFSRVHVDDIVAAVMLGLDAAPGAYNIADDYPCSQNKVVEAAAALLGLPPPPFVTLDTLSPMARSFYQENRRVANSKAKRVLGWTPTFPDFAVGLRALHAQ